MQNYLIYLLQVCGWFIPLYILYLLVYKKFTFFNWNRYYLLSITMLSFILPLVHYNIVKSKIIWSTINSGIVENTTFYETVTPNLQTAVAQNLQTPNLSFSFLFIVFIVYFIGAIINAFKLLKSLYSIRVMIKNAQKNWTSNVALVHTTDKVPHSSFFHYIFINNKTKSGNDMDKIIYHEMQHNEKLHSIDVLLCEIVKIILWFNPFVYWHKQSLQEVHEFEVDSEMTKLYNEVNYAELLLKIATANQHILINTFSTKPIKTRIKMIFNPKTYPMKKLSFLLVLPLVATLLLAYGNIQRKTITIVKTTTNPITIVIDAGHGGKDMGAVSGANYESKITLEIAQKLAAKAKASGYNVVLTRSTDTFVALKDRALMAIQNKAALFISLHLNTATVKTANGIEAYVGKNTTDSNYQSSMDVTESVLNSLQNISGIITDTKAKPRTAGIYILKNTNTPGLLLELGYLSNTNDLEFITNTNNQDAIADKIVEGFTKYFASK